MRKKLKEGRRGEEWREDRKEGSAGAQSFLLPSTSVLLGPIHYDLLENSELDPEPEKVLLPVCTDQ